MPDLACGQDPDTFILHLPPLPPVARTRLQHPDALAEGLHILVLTCSGKHHRRWPSQQLSVKSCDSMQVGGMGDVVTALGRAVQDEGHRVEVILPKYDCMDYDQVRTFARQLSQHRNDLHLVQLLGLAPLHPIKCVTDQHWWSWTCSLYGRTTAVFNCESCQLLDWSHSIPHTTPVWCSVKLGHTLSGAQCLQAASAQLKSQGWRQLHWTSCSQRGCQTLETGLHPAARAGRLTPVVWPLRETQKADAWHQFRQSVD